MVSALDEGGQALLAVALRRRLAHFVLDIAFCAPAGRTVLFGPSGAGKSLTLQAVAGLVPLEQASIRLGATTWHDSTAGICVPPQARRTGYLPQQYALFPHLTVAQNVAFGQRRRGSMSRKRVAELLALMQLEGLERVYPAHLSGGQQQRVALARALASEPQLLLLDEPWSALDGPVRAVLRAEVQRFYEQVGVPLLLVTHDVQDVQDLADTVVVIDRGRVLQTGSPAAVFRAPRTPRVAQLVGMEMHWQGVVTALEPAAAHGQLATVEVAQLALRALPPFASQLRVGQSVRVSFLPDEIEPLPAGRELVGEEQTAVLVEATVLQVQARGLFYALTVCLGAGVQLVLPVPRWHYRALAPGVGARLRLSIPCAAVHLFEPEEPVV